MTVRTLVGALVLLLASPAAAQIPGVRFGQTVAEVQAVIGDTPPVAITSSPGAQIIFQDGRYVAFCDGRAISMQYQFGSTLNDFAAEVEEEVARSGEPTFKADNMRTMAGEMSTVTARWDYPTYKLEIAVFEQSGTLSATRTVTARESDCMPGSF